jgi:Cu/Ag efflux pump CusA
MIIGTLLTLFVVPAIYMAIARRDRSSRKPENAAPEPS